MAQEMPQGAPQAPQAPQGAPKQDIGSLVSGIFEGLNTLQDVMERAKVPPTVTQRLARLATEYQAIIESLQGGEEPEGQEMAPKGPTTPEAGAGNAVPAM